MLCARSLFERDHIFGILAEGQARVGGGSFRALLLKSRGESLGFLFCAFFRPCGLNFKGGGIRALAACRPRHAPEKRE